MSVYPDYMIELNLDIWHAGSFFVSHNLVAKWYMSKFTATE